MTRHKSQAYFHALSGARDEVSKQARFVLRMAVAWHAAGVAYNVTWERLDGRMLAKLEAEGDLPTPKPFPKVPATPKARESWKPRPFEAEYRLDALRGSTGKPIPGFVIEHSCGLALVKAGESESGELSADYGKDILDGWSIIHSASKLGLGLTLRFSRAKEALLYASTLLDWTVNEETLKARYMMRGRLAQQRILERFGASHQAKEQAKQFAAGMEAAAAKEEAEQQQAAL